MVVLSFFSAINRRVVHLTAGAEEQEKQAQYILCQILYQVNKIKI